MRNRSLLWGAFIVIVVVLLVAFHQLAFFRPLEDGLALALRPLQSATFPGGQAIQAYLQRRDTETRLRERLAAVERDNQALVQENSRLNLLITDLHILRSEEDFLNANAYQHVVARVIGRTSDNIVEEVIINRGDHDGIRTGQAVVTENGFLLGKVVSTTQSTAKVLVATDSRSEIAAVVQNDTGSPGLVVGLHGLALEMQLIPQNELVQADQTVITSGLESHIPKGIVLGKIQSVSVPAGEIFQRATIRSDVNYRQSGVVSVIIFQSQP